MKCKKLKFITLCLVLWALGAYPFSSYAGIADSMMINSLRLKGIVPIEDNRVEIFSRGAEKFDDLFESIRSARHHVHVEYFIFADDSLGHTFLNLLCEKAREGVEVRLIIDSFKAVTRNYGFTERKRNYLRSVGVDVRMFDPFKFPYINHVPRDHRKIVVVDGRVGYIGGFNVSDYYIKGDPNTYGEWRDTHVRIVGPAVEGLQRLFMNAYVLSGGEEFDGVDYYPFFTHNSLNKGVLTDYFNWSSVFRHDGKRIGPGIPGATIAYVERSRESKAKKAEMREIFVHAFNSAQHKIRLVSPYLLPTRSVRKAIIAALDRGVEVEILLSESCDEPILLYGNLNFARRLLNHGARIYIYRGAFHHSKILMVDDVYCMVGSANLNSRSLRWDYEANCIIFSPQVTDSLSAIFELDKQKSAIFSTQSYREIPIGKRILGGFVNHFLTPIL